MTMMSDEAKNPFPPARKSHEHDADYAALLHADEHEPGGSDEMAVDAAAGTGSLRTLGTGAAQAAAGNHAHTAEHKVAIKTSAQEFNGDTLTNVTSMSFVSGSSEVWAFEMWVPFVSEGSADDLKLAITFAGTLRWSLHPGIDTDGNPDVPTLVTSSGAALSIGATTTARVALIKGIVSGAGTVQLQAAKNTEETGDITTIQSLAHVIAHRIA